MKDEVRIPVYPTITRSMEDRAAREGVAWRRRIGGQRAKGRTLTVDTTSITTSTYVPDAIYVERQLPWPAGGSLKVGVSCYTETGRGRSIRYESVFPPGTDPSAVPAVRELMDLGMIGDPGELRSIGKFFDMERSSGRVAIVEHELMGEVLHHAHEDLGGTAAVEPLLVPWGPIRLVDDRPIDEMIKERRAWHGMYRQAQAGYIPRQL